MALNWQGTDRMDWMGTDCSWAGDVSLSGGSTQAWTDPTLLSISTGTLQVWLDPNDNSKITNVGGKCTQIIDKSSNAYVFSQATGTKQPTITAAGLNGLQTFTTVQASVQSLIGTLSAALTDATVMAVIYSTTNTLGNGIFTSYVNTGDMSLILDTVNAGGVSVYLTSVGPQAQSAAGTIVANTAYCVAYNYNSTGAGLITTYVNNVSKGSSGQASAVRHMNQLVGWPTSVGWAQSFDGQLGDVVVYSGSLSVADMTTLYTSFFKPKWALP